MEAGFAFFEIFQAKILLGICQYYWQVTFYYNAPAGTGCPLRRDRVHLPPKIHLNSLQ